MTLQEKMRAAGCSDLRIRHFERQVDAYRNGLGGFLPEDSLCPVGDLPAYSDLPDDPGSPVGQVVVLKLNGGLGTSMGLDGPKSLLSVKDGRSFLDILVGQVLALRQQTGQAVPLVLMNSAATSAETLARLPDLAQGVPVELLQSVVPKLDRETGEPVAHGDDPDLEWCPPGHGDLYPSLLETGLLERLLEQGVRYAFVSNADNLGATLDRKILAWFASRQVPFLMEVTRRTAADRKGGHLGRDARGLLLREVAQCRPEDQPAFQDVERHRFFNTNNLWLNLELLRPHLPELQLPLIVNHKTVNPRDRGSRAVVQLETAMGAAISALPGSLALDVPRGRFLPVKKTSDLLVVRSDCYRLRPEDCHLVQVSRGLPTVALDDRFYGNLADFDARFPQGAELADCQTLAVTGDVTFPVRTRFVGDVRLSTEATAVWERDEATGTHQL